MGRETVRRPYELEAKVAGARRDPEGPGESVAVRPTQTQGLRTERGALPCRGHGAALAE